MSVCGCNGISYTSACAAHALGVSVAYDRSCSLPPNACGNSESFPTVGAVPCNDPNALCIPGTCAPGAFVFGSCAVRPTTCPDVDDPVCACGTTTYRNVCLALQAGALAGPSACPVTEPPRSCTNPFSIGQPGCFPEEYCNTNERCRNPLGGRPGLGVCQDVPSSCPPVDAPVCGCDRVTYVNECEAHRARASVAAHGPC